MTDLIKIIKGLEQFIEDFKPFCGNKVDWQRVYDALALLKAQEPRVMALEEVERLSYEPVYYESKTILPRWVIIEMNLKQDIQMLVSSGRVQCDKSSYGKRWRCWTSRPDDKRRAETPWERLN